VKAETEAAQPAPRRHGRPARHWLEYAAARFLGGVLRWMPRGGVEAIGRLIGSLSYFVFRSRREVALKNLDLAFGDSMSQEEKQRVVRKAFSNFGYWFLDFLTYDALPPEKLAARIRLTSPARAVFQEAFSRGKGVLFLLSHFGNWELMGLYFGLDSLFEAAVVAKALHNERIDRWVNRIRSCTGNTVIYADQASVKIVRTLKKNHGVAIVFDQDTSLRHGGVYSKFFGQGCVTHRSVATLHLATGAPILSAHCLPLPGGCFEVHAELVEEFEPSGDREEDVQRLTQRCNEVIEKYIRRNPENYFWLHKRWKHRPPGCPPVYEAPSR